MKAVHAHVEVSIESVIHQYGGSGDSEAAARTAPMMRSRIIVEYLERPVDCAIRLKQEHCGQSVSDKFMGSL
jgi:hypothetical protein